MSERERLHAIIDTLSTPTEQISDEEFARILSKAPEEEFDEEVIARVLAAAAEVGENISHEELERCLEL